MNLDSAMCNTQPLDPGGPGWGYRTQNIALLWDQSNCWQHLRKKRYIYQVLLVFSITLHILSTNIYNLMCLDFINASPLLTNPQLPLKFDNITLIAKMSLRISLYLHVVNCMIYLSQTFLFQFITFCPCDDNTYHFLCNM